MNIALLIEHSVNTIDRLNTGIRFTPEEQDYICNSLERIELKKKGYLIKEGEVEECLYFIETGILRYWKSDMNDKEITFWFSFKEEFANSYYSLKNKQPSEFNIQSLCETIVWRIDRKILSNLYGNSLNVNKIARIVLENALIRKIERELNTLGLSSEERYKRLIEKEKDLFLSVPLKYIASYLGITPQALCAIRRRT